jgi:hypothetical protein
MRSIRLVMRQIYVALDASDHAGLTLVIRSTLRRISWTLPTPVNGRVRGVSSSGQHSVPGKINPGAIAQIPIASFTDPVAAFVLCHDHAPPYARSARYPDCSICQWVRERYRKMILFCLGILHYGRGEAFLERDTTDSWRPRHPAGFRVTRANLRLEPRPH